MRSNANLQIVQVIETHTAGEPTRVVVAGAPDLGTGSVAERTARFAVEHDAFRCAIVNEPRGSDVLVGAILIEPSDKTCAAGVIFFNNVGVLGMCGHGTIGLIETLAFMGRITPGTHRIETCVGIVTATWHEDGRVSVQNVKSYRAVAGAVVDVPGIGAVRGDVAWAGNWFYLVSQHGQTLTLDRVEALTDLAWRIRKAINTGGYPLVDHVELFGPPVAADAHSRSFVLCPGKAYDRSPCGTGTSAKLACLAADRKLNPGQTWVQESIIGSTFEARFEWIDESEGTISPTIVGRAYVIGRADLILDLDDPFCWGIR